jgi:hypothetical protein
VLADSYIRRRRVEEDPFNPIWREDREPIWNPKDVAAASGDSAETW